MACTLLGGEARQVHALIGRGFGKEKMAVSRTWTNTSAERVLRQIEQLITKTVLQILERP
jgi:hypothetical protein